MDQKSKLKLLVRLGFVIEFSALVVMLLMKMGGHEIPESIAWVFFIGLCVAAFGTLFLIRIQKQENKNKFK